MERGQNCQERRRRPEHFSASASAASAFLSLSFSFSFSFAAPVVGVRGLSRSALPLTSNRRPGTTLGSIIVHECIHSRGMPRMSYCINVLWIVCVTMNQVLCGSHLLKRPGPIMSLHRLVQDALDGPASGFRSHPHIPPLPELWI